MDFRFSKYCATGNDFVVVDNRQGQFDQLSSTFWQNVCDRRFGVGADGVLMVCASSSADFRMCYLNADGGEVEMCGNGARSIVAFCRNDLKMTQQTFNFETLNGRYECSVDPELHYKLKMTELYDIEKFDLNGLMGSSKSMYLNTGVPHCVFEVKSLNQLDINALAKPIRHHSMFERGTNVNFFERLSDHQIKLRTFERGVEDETLSCGTGATAAAIAFSKLYQVKDKVVVKVMGGELVILFNQDFSEIYLCGKAEKIFEGTYLGR